MLLGDGDEYGGVALDRCGAQAWQGAAHAHVGHVGHGDEAARGVGAHYRGAQLLGRGAVELAFDDVLLAVVVYDAARGIVVEGLDGGGELVEAHAVCLHALGRESYLILALVAALHRYLRYAAQGEQPRAHRAVGDGAQVEHRGGVGREADGKHLAQYRRCRAHDRSIDAGRQLLGHCGEALAHGLAGAVEVGVPVKLDIDHRETRGARRAYTTHARGAVERRLHGESHYLLDILGGHARRLGHHGDCGRVEVGEDVYFGAQQHSHAGDEYDDAQHQHTEAIGQRPMYDTV